MKETDGNCRDAGIFPAELAVQLSWLSYYVHERGLTITLAFIYWNGGHFLCWAYVAYNPTLGRCA